MEEFEALAGYDHLLTTKNDSLRGYFVRAVLEFVHLPPSQADESYNLSTKALERVRDTFGTNFRTLLALRRWCDNFASVCRKLDKRVLLAVHFLRQYPKESQIFFLDESDAKGHREWNRKILGRMAELPKVRVQRSPSRTLPPPLQMSTSLTLHLANAIASFFCLCASTATSTLTASQPCPWIRFPLACAQALVNVRDGKPCVFMDVDTTLVYIKLKGSRDNTDFYSVEHQRAGLKVEYATVANSPYGPFIVSCHVAPGRNNDLTVAREDLVTHLIPNELILADRIYTSQEFISAGRHQGVHPSNVPYDCRVHDSMNHHQAPIERVNSWTHNFKIFAGFEHYTRGRNAGPRLDLLHNAVFVAITLVNRNTLDCHGEVGSMFVPHRAHAGHNAGRLGIQ